MGLEAEQAEYLLKYHPRFVTKFKKHYSYFEKIKSRRGVYDIPDGITCDAIFCMRDALRELPRLYQKEPSLIDPNSFIEIIRSGYAKKKDLSLTSSRVRHISLFQKCYLEMMQKVAKQFHGSRLSKILLEVGMRSSIRNPYDRITGDGVLFVTDQIIKDKKRLSIDEIHQVMLGIIQTQLTVKRDFLKEKGERVVKKVRQNIKIIRDYRESI